MELVELSPPLLLRVLCCGLPCLSRSIRKHGFPWQVFEVMAWKTTLVTLLHRSGDGLGAVFCFVCTQAHAYTGSVSASSDMEGNTSGYLCSVHTTS